MKEWKTSLALKITAVVLFAACLAAAGASLLGIVCGYEMGIYQGITDPKESGFARSAAFSFSSEIIDSYMYGGSTLEELTAYSAGDNCNFVFALYETAPLYTEGKETLLASTLEIVPDHRIIQENIIRESRVTSERLYEEVPDVDGGSHSEPPKDEDMEAVRRFRVVVGVKEKLPYHYGSFYFNCMLFYWLSQYKNVLIAVLAAAVLLGITDFVLLCCMAGHRKGREDIVCNWADRIPFDLYASAAVIAASILIIIAFDGCFPEANPFFIITGCLCILAAAMVALAVVLSLATRVKAGQWWRNTVIYRVLHWGVKLLRRGWRLIVRVFRAVPLVWRSGLVTGGMLLLLCFFGGTETWVLFFLLSLVILAAVVLAAYELRLLQRGGETLAAGNFEAKVDTAHMFWDFKRHGENLNAVGQGMTIAVEERMKSERLKTELITNVSHDIKTPLTSIINYVDLLQKPHTEEEEAQYLEVLERQSARLKKLTEDLVEASKASTGNLPVNLVSVNVAEALDQALAEYQERLAAGTYQIVTSYPDRETAIVADGRLFWRVVDNLLNNVCKYAMPGTRVYVGFEQAAEWVRIAVKNISSQPLNISADELIERFVRGDTARSTEGSGLGLNIAKSLTELQNGKLQLTVDGDLFKAELYFSRVLKG